MRAGATPAVVLVTGFEPFAGEPVNPSQLLAAELIERPPLAANLVLRAGTLPVDRERLRPTLETLLARERPDALVALGQAAGRDRLDLELRAVNAIDYQGRADNGGHVARGEALHGEGPPELVVPQAWHDLAAELARAGHLLRLSWDAGRHLCNALLYELLWRHADLPAVFVHVPLLPEQATRRGRGEPALSQAVTRACLEDLLRRLPSHSASARRVGA